MANGETGNSSDGSFPNPTSFLKQILSKLRDPAALYSLALFILAFPLGKAMDNYPLAYWMALAFSLPVLGLRAYQISVQGKNDARRLELDNAAKLATISSNHQLKLAKLHLKAHSTSPSSIPSISSKTLPSAIAPPQTAQRLPIQNPSQPHLPRQGRKQKDPAVKGP